MFLSQNKNPDELLVLDKPAGIGTHSSGRDPAFLETMSFCLGNRLLPIHRLDKGTSGVLLTSANPDVVRDWSEAWAHGHVKKEYVFISRSPWQGATDTLTVDMEIDGKLASTELICMASSPGGCWVKAHPLTGRTHQIRLAAAQAQVPILGDDTYGGAHAERLFLHASRVSRGEVDFESPVPAAFWHVARELDVLPPVNLKQADGACGSATDEVSVLIDRVSEDRRRGWREVFLTDSDCLRWWHTEHGVFRMDQYGPGLTFQVFGESTGGAHGAMDWTGTLEAARERLGADFWWAREMPRTRGAQPRTWSSPGAPNRWTCSENGILFDIRADQGQSWGLFLDQKWNRREVRRMSRDLRVLNLFCYTGGFSVAALAGGASTVTSVDAMPQMREWVETNLSLNELPLDAHRFQAWDARAYLAWAARKRMKWDLIVVDPPSFGRSDKGVFRLRTDLPELLRLAAAVLADEGEMLVTCNFEDWSQVVFEETVLTAIPHLQRGRQIPASPDFELPGEPTILKSVWLKG